MFSVIIRKLKVSLIKWGSTEVYKKRISVPWGISTKNWETPLEGSTWNVSVGLLSAHFTWPQEGARNQSKSEAKPARAPGLGFVSRTRNPALLWPPGLHPNSSQGLSAGMNPTGLDGVSQGCPTKARGSVDCQKDTLKSSWVFWGNGLCQCTPCRVGCSWTLTTGKVSNLNRYIHTPRKHNLG